MPTIGLNSDFRDYYDHWFDRTPHTYTLSRQSVDAKRKRDQFILLQQMGFNVPLNGLVKDIAPTLEQGDVVVYTDETAHKGEGKVMMHADKALEQYPDYWCSEFIHAGIDNLDRGLGAASHRLLVIGDRLWWLRYESLGNWRSNYGNDVTVTVKGEISLDRRGFAEANNLDFSFVQQYPLFAIDVVDGAFHFDNQQMVAIDFNSAPGLKGTGIEEVLDGKEVVELIRSFVRTSQLETFSGVYEKTV